MPLKSKILYVIMALCGITATAKDPIVIDVWPDGAPNPVAFDFSDDYVKRNNLVENPVLLVYPAERPSGKAVVMCPGGGYGHLAKYHEGTDMADWMNARGITYAVLLYRMPQGHRDVPVSDALEAIRIMRQKGPEMGHSLVGIAGASAGGHLASSAATHYTSAENRPDFQILFYPVISMIDGITHRGSRDNLLGRDASDEDVALFSNELQVTADTPHAFIMHSSDDKVVPVDNSLRYYKALTDHGVYSTLHTYPVGGHGWGFRDSFPYKPDWTLSLASWLNSF